MKLVILTGLGTMNLVYVGAFFLKRAEGHYYIIAYAVPVIVCLAVFMVTLLRGGGPQHSVRGDRVQYGLGIVSMIAALPIADDAALVLTKGFVEVTPGNARMGTRVLRAISQVFGVDIAALILMAVCASMIVLGWYFITSFASERSDP